jgi:YD repeat-containing protein
MRNYLYYLILAIVFYSCGDNTKTNLEIRKEIDSLEIENVIYEFEVDSLDRIIDTLSIAKNKINDIGTIVFNEKTTYANHGHLKSINYYRDNENLFYQKYESSELGILSTSEFWEENNVILNGIYLSYENNKINKTITLKYNHHYNDNGKRKKTTITSKHEDQNETGNITERNYDDSDNLISEIIIQNRDTIFEIDYAYSKNILKNKTIIDYNEGTLINFIYDNEGYVQGEEVFKAESDSLLKIKEAHYETNNKGEIIKKIETELPSEEKKYIKFINGTSKVLREIKA